MKNASQPVTSTEVMRQIKGNDFDLILSDYHLDDGSPLIDLADPQAATAVDFDGDVRPQGAHPDIGADERKQP